MTKKSSIDLNEFICTTDCRIDVSSREKLVKSRIRLLFSNPFFGNMASRLRLVNADEWCSTAATDGVNFYYNSKFIDILHPDELTFLVCHEVLHVAYDHMNRLGDRDSNIYNIATDYAVNADLKRHKIGKFITTVPALYDEKYDKMTSEEIYEDLVKNMDKINVQELLDMLLDDHMDGHESESGSSSTDGENSSQKKNKPTLTKEQRDQISKEIKQAIISAAQQSDAGHIPAGIKRELDAWLNPTLPWKDLIHMNVNSTVKHNYTWMRPSRRGWHLDAVLPSMLNDQRIEVDVAIDASGSITEKQINTFLSEIKSIMETFEDHQINVFAFDTTVYNEKQFSSDNDEDIRSYSIYGGGGTSFDCIFDHLKKVDRVPKMLIVFTDGYPNGSWGDSNYTDVTWVIHGSKSIIPPYGTWAYFD
jgi:predicted metal-dependent peptidase